MFVERNPLPHLGTQRIAEGLCAIGQPAIGRIGVEIIVEPCQLALRIDIEAVIAIPGCGRAKAPGAGVGITVTEERAGIAMRRTILPGDPGNQLPVGILIELPVDTGLHDEAVDILLHAGRAVRLKPVMRALDARPDPAAVDSAAACIARVVVVPARQIAIADTFLQRGQFVEHLHVLRIALIDRNTGTIARVVRIDRAGIGLLAIGAGGSCVVWLVRYQLPSLLPLPAPVAAYRHRHRPQPPSDRPWWCSR